MNGWRATWAAAQITGAVFSSLVWIFVWRLSLPTLLVTMAVGTLGAFNTVGGSVITEGDQRVGDHGFSSFGLGGDNSAHQDVHATVANGLGNFVGGNVITEGSQSVGNHGFGSFGFGGGDNMAHQDVSATVANGAFNAVLGNVVTEGHQSVGDHGMAMHPFH